MADFFGMDVTAPQLGVMLCFSFLAGFIDSIAGGGGLIQIPALMTFFPGVPTIFLLGTNKLASCCGTALAAIRFSRTVAIDRKRMLPIAGMALGAGILGAAIALHVPNRWLRPLVVVLLTLILVYTLTNRSAGTEKREGVVPPDRRRIAGLAAGLMIGLYDGFFGPGTGNFLILTLIFIYGLNFVEASASSKVVNLATNIGALILFFKAGTVYVALGLTLAIFNMTGAFFGVKLATLKGSDFVRVLFIVVVIALLARQVSDLIAGWQHSFLLEF